MSFAPPAVHIGPHRSVPSPHQSSPLFYTALAHPSSSSETHCKSCLDLLPPLSNPLPTSCWLFLLTGAQVLTDNFVIKCSSELQPILLSPGSLLIVSQSILLICVTSLLVKATFISVSFYNIGPIYNSNAIYFLDIYIWIY